MDPVPPALPPETHPTPGELTEADASHLKLLAVFHYIFAGFTFLFGCFFIIYIVMGIAMLANPEFIQREMMPADAQPYQTHEQMQEDVLFGGEAPPGPMPVEADLDLDPAPLEFQQPSPQFPQDDGITFFGAILVGFGTGLMLFAWILAALMIVAGRALQKCKRLLLCQMVAAITCILFPFGTVLGVFTLIALQRPRIAEAFRRNNR